ncbi:hypothetical protein [Nocardia sp. NPDC004711]
MVDKWAAAFDDTTVADIQADLKPLHAAGFVIVDAETFEVLLAGISTWPASSATRTISRRPARGRRR